MYDSAFTPQGPTYTVSGAPVQCKSVNSQGCSNYCVRNVATGEDTKVSIQSAVEVSDEAVEKMLADSLEHAFEDMDERALTELCLKAQEMVPAVERALERLGQEVTEAERAQISALLEQISEAREARSLPSLKAALNELDHVTEPIAARLVEGMMEGRL